jgi:hypothetical protein
MGVDSPNLAEPWPVRFTGWPNHLSVSNDGENPGEDDSNGKSEDRDQSPNSSNYSQIVYINDWRPKEEGLCVGLLPAMTCVLSEAGVPLRKIRVDEDGNPDGDREQYQSPPYILLPPEHCLEAVGGPKSPDGISGEVNVNRRAHDGYEDDGVVSGQVPSDERNPTGE